MKEIKIMCKNKKNMNRDGSSKVVNEDEGMSVFGEKSGRGVMYKRECKKLDEGLCVKEKKVIDEGMGVGLDRDGNMEGYMGGGDGREVYVGIGVSEKIKGGYEGERNLGVEVSVGVEGLMVVKWVGKEGMECGYVKGRDRVLIEGLMSGES